MGTCPIPNPKHRSARDGVRSFRISLYLVDEYVPASAWRRLIPQKSMANPGLQIEIMKQVGFVGRLGAWRNKNGVVPPSVGVGAQSG